MKPHQRRAAQQHHLRLHDHRLLLLLMIQKHYAWLIWFSLSLYLFLSTSPASFLAASIDSTVLRRPAAAATRALAEAPHPLPRIYVYELPPRFNRAWLADPRCGEHLFAAEVALHQALLDSPARELDPDCADFYFVPVYVSCNFSTVNGFPALGHARALIADAVSLLPYWNRSSGRDHVFVASHDYGACFHAMEDVAIADGIPDIIRSSVLLQTFGVRSPHPCQEAEHVVIPPYVPPAAALSSPDPATVERDIWVYFRGKMEVHPKNISGRFYSKRVRTEIWERYSGRRRFYLRRKRHGGYREEIARAVYCLCPRGWAPWSPRLVEAVALGCIPVIIADGIRLPLPEAVPWPGISLSVAEREIGGLEALLDNVDRTNRSAIQRNLWDPRVRAALLYNRPMSAGDATWHVLEALRRISDRRSWRRGMRSTNKKSTRGR